MAQTPTTTQNLGLNQWNSADNLNTPQFNEDNRLIDNAVGSLRRDVTDVENDVNEIKESGILGSDEIVRAIINRIYEGVDLTVKFAAEIAAAPHSGNVWAWIRARIRSGNFSGLLVGDFIPFQIGNNTIIAEIAGINTYTRYGAPPRVENHIDFISRDLFPEARQFNRAPWNNGTTVSPSPWLASDLFAWLNGLQMDVPNTRAVNPELINVDYRTTGLFPQLPAALRTVIVPKQLYLSRRHSPGAILSDDMGGMRIDNVGNLWILSEIEVFGHSVVSSLLTGGFSPQMFGGATGGVVQYPIFANNMKRIKGAGHEGAPAHWWLLDPVGGSDINFSTVWSVGYGTQRPADSTQHVPVCFRIA